MVRIGLVLLLMGAGMAFDAKALADALVREPQRNVQGDASEEMYTRNPLIQQMDRLWGQLEAGTISDAEYYKRSLEVKKKAPRDQLHQYFDRMNKMREQEMRPQRGPSDINTFDPIR